MRFCSDFHPFGQLSDWSRSDMMVRQYCIGNNHTSTCFSMNHIKPRFSRPLALVLCLLATASSAFAFPPAPTFTVHGIARDPFGWAIQSTDNATVVLKVNGVVVATSAVDERPRTGENFRLAVPMDTRDIDPYRTGAQTTGNFFSLEVRFPNTTMPAATINSADNRVGRPGELLFVDFSVGEDSDGDGIPDAWEWWQLSEMGIGPGHELWSLNTFGNGDFSGNGTSDFLHYLSGTFAFLSEEKFALAITGFDDDGTPRLAAFLVHGKTYRVERSTDLKTWTRIPIRLAPEEEDPPTTFTADDTREFTLRPAAPSPAPATALFRLVLVR